MALTLKEDASLKYILRYKNVFAFLVIVAIFYFVISKIVSYQDTQKKNLIKEIELLEEKKASIDEFNKLEKEYRSLAKSFLSKDILIFKQFIEENAQRLEIEIISLRTNAKEEKLYWEVEMLLKVSCAYSDFLKFITATEAKKILVDSIKVTRKEGRSEIDLSLKGIILK